MAPRPRSAARITATADIAYLWATIEGGYQAARADGFDPATARLTHP